MRAFLFIAVFWFLMSLLIPNVNSETMYTLFSSIIITGYLIHLYRICYYRSKDEDLFLVRKIVASNLFDDLNEIPKWVKIGDSTGPYMIESNNIKGFTEYHRVKPLISFLNIYIRKRINNSHELNEKSENMVSFKDTPEFFRSSQGLNKFKL